MKNILKNVLSVHEICYSHLIKSGLALFVDITYLNEKTNFANFHGKKLIFINRLKQAQHKRISICIDVHIKYEVNDFNKIEDVLSKFKKN